jgi:hypothetical protein
METLLITACIISAVVCAIGALHPSFDDNLAQRCGMGAAALACTGMAYSGRYTPSTALLVTGVACYALGTVFKLCKQP